MKTLTLIGCLLMAGIAIADTNTTERVQCAAQTRSGARCKRKAAQGERYCKQHSAANVPKKTPEKCRSFTDDGKPCEAKPVENRNYCRKHLKQ